MNSKEKLAEIDRKILKLSIFSLPGPILTAFALLGKYGEPEAIPVEFLNDAMLTSVMLGLGVVILFGTGYFIVKLGIEKANAQSESDQ